MNEQLLNLLDAVQCLHSFCYSLLFAFEMNSKCSRRSHLEHLKSKIQKTIGRPGLRPGPYWGSSQRSPRPPSWWGGARRSLPKNPTPHSALRASGCGPSGLTKPVRYYPPHFQIPSNATESDQWQTVRLQLMLNRPDLSQTHDVRRGLHCMIA